MAEETAPLPATGKVYPSGLTLMEAQELHKYMSEGTKAFGVVALVAHFLAFAFSPWLHFG